MNRENRSAGEKKENERNKSGEKWRLWKTEGKAVKSWKTCGKSGGQAVKTCLFSHNIPHFPATVAESF